MNEKRKGWDNVVPTSVPVESLLAAAREVADAKRALREKAGEESADALTVL